MIVRPLAKLFTVALSASLLVWSAPLRAAHREGPEPATAPAPNEIDPADLTAQREQAAAAALADPSAAKNHRRMGELAEQAGDLQAAEASYKAELDALDTSEAKARATAKENLERVREKSRGKIADEGASTHRDDLDRAWAPTKPPTETKPPGRAPIAKATPDDRIVKKWYFWVTLAAIAGAAAAVTAIAIKASRDDKPDALDRGARLPIGGSGLRF